MRQLVASKMAAVGHRRAGHLLLHLAEFACLSLKLLLELLSEQRIVWLLDVQDEKLVDAWRADGWGGGGGEIPVSMLIYSKRFWRFHIIGRILFSDSCGANFLVVVVVAVVTTTFGAV